MSRQADFMTLDTRSFKLNELKGTKVLFLIVFLLLVEHTPVESRASIVNPWVHSCSTGCNRESPLSFSSQFLSSVWESRFPGDQKWALDTFQLILLMIFIYIFLCNKLGGRNFRTHVILSRDLILNGKQIVLMNLLFLFNWLSCKGRNFFFTMESNAFWGPF